MSIEITQPGKYKTEKMNGNAILDTEDLRVLYAWLDSIPLSRPKRNIAEDFSDGGPQNDYYRSIRAKLCIKSNSFPN